jgi:hypothetical protein
VTHFFELFIANTTLKITERSEAVPSTEEMKPSATFLLLGLLGKSFASAGNKHPIEDTSLNVLLNGNP